MPEKRANFAISELPGSENEGKQQRDSENWEE
jgi:hypothetical protein